MDSQFDQRKFDALLIDEESYGRDYAQPTRPFAAPQQEPKAALSEEAAVHLVWFSAAMLGMPALIAALALIF